MSPIIELQRRMVEAGRIRSGDSEGGRPRKLDKWRLTSKDNERLLAARELWGGTYSSWRDDEWQLYTDTNVLPIMLLPGQIPSTWYELWTKGGCQRRCDGVHEVISDAACLCGDERECKPHTRLSVLLPDLPGIGSWLLSSTGWNAAAELAGAADLLQRASAQGVLIPARLRLEQRTSVKGGVTRKYAVPVIDLDTSFRELLGAQGALAPGPSRAALPSGYTPVAPVAGNGTSLAEGLAEAERVSLPGRSAPIPVSDVDVEPAPVPVEEESGASTTAGSESGSPSDDSPDAPANIETVSKLVGSLRRRKLITTENVWVAVAKLRGVEVDVMIELLKGRDKDGELHWPALRDDLQEGEIADLHERLMRLHKNAPKKETVSA